MCTIRRLLASPTCLHWIQARPDDGRSWSEESIAYTEELHYANQTAFCHVDAGAGFHEPLYNLAAMRLPLEG